MTASPAQSQPAPLAPATFNAMLCSTMDALPYPPRATQNEIATRREAAYLVIEALGPRDPLESMLASRVVAMHYHVMHNLGCATQRDLPPNLQLRFQGRAVALSRVMDATLNNLMDRQTAAPRSVAGLSTAAELARTRPAPEPVRAEPAPAPPATATATDRPTQAAPAQGASARTTPPPANVAATPASPTAPIAQPTAPSAQAAATALQAKLAASAATPAQGEKFPIDAAMAEQLLEEAAVRMDTSLDAILALAA